MSDKKLDHDTEKTEEIVKSVNPDSGFMKASNLCTKCHGPRRRCERPECPQVG